MGLDEPLGRALAYMVMASERARAGNWIGAHNALDSAAVCLAHAREWLLTAQRGKDPRE